MEAWAIDPDRVRRGQLEVLDWSVVLRDCDEGTWTMTLVDDDLSRQVVSGWRIVMVEDQGTLVSGPVLSWGGDVGDESLTLSGIDDTGMIGFRVTYPDWSKPAEQQTDAAYFKRTGPAGEVIDYMVFRNIGPYAIESRRVDGWAHSPASGGRFGSTVSVNTRYKNLLDEARTLARLGGVTFSAAQDANSTRIYCRFREPVDRSRWVRFSRDDGGLTGGSYEFTAPTVTNVLVAGQGQGADRTIKEHSASSGDWGMRIEQFQDRRDTDDATELEQAGTETLAEGAASASASVEVEEIPGLVYGVDYQLGDTVLVDFGRAQITEPVRAVELSGDGFGRTAKLTLGDHAQDEDQDPAWVKHVRKLSRDLRRLETI